MEALGRKFCETAIVSTSGEPVKKKNYKKFKSKNTNKNAVNRVFGLRIAQSGINK